MKQIAIIGPTASGKSDLALELADTFNANILSIDSLSIYKEIDIASAKPSHQELLHVKHFGINELYPNETFSVATFINLYLTCKAQTETEGKNLIIVGGSSFYLKSLLSGLSVIPEISDATKREAKAMLCNTTQAYEMLYTLDSHYMKDIDSQDSYRIEKMLHLYLQTNTIPSQWFKKNPPQATIKSLNIFNIDVEREVLRERIQLRTYKMLKLGLIDEITSLEKSYGRTPNSMKAIGIIEVLEYLDGLTCKEEMIENIITHTAQLAKRQQTFNNNQFENILHVKREELFDLASKSFDKVK
ncbi:MAG: tRNA (adenosine(37)-N6)-dimethylallyltransferase MiaA [Campylobacterota bacterium]|nr:tRNA (adenosine(37)-N6)-dimethylallyltransferase MiaA [Campylobacterota bacterium]